MGADATSNLFMFAAIAFLVVMMFLNSRKRKKAQAEMNTALKPGAWIMTTSGIFGEVVAIEDDKIVLESTPGVKLLIIKGAVAKVVDAPAVSALAKPAAAKKAATTSAATAKKSAAPKKPAAKKPAASAAKK